MPEVASLLAPGHDDQGLLVKSEGERPNDAPRAVFLQVGIGNLDLQFFADGMTDAFDELGIDRGPDFRRDQESTGFQALLELRRDDGADLGQGVASGQRQAIVAALYYPTRPQNYGFDLVGENIKGGRVYPGRSRKPTPASPSMGAPWDWSVAMSL